MSCSLMRVLVHGLGNQTRVISEQTPWVQSFDETGLRVEEVVPGSTQSPQEMVGLRLGEGGVSLHIVG